MTSSWIQDRFKNRDGAELFYRFYPLPGARHTVIIVHGYGEHSGRYEKFPEKMCGLSIQMAAMDFRGMGRSGAVRGTVGSFEDYLRDVSAFVEHLQAKRLCPRNFILFGHSMGGLVCRSACHYGQAAGHRWTGALRSLVTLGAPHEGAPLERIGNWVGLVTRYTPYAVHFSRLARVRSAGITDLRYGNLLDEDWEGRDRFARGRDTRRAVPMPEGAELFAVAAMVSAAGEDGDGAARRLLGDGLVPLESALGRHEDPRLSLGLPPERQWVAYETTHLDLLGSIGVYERLRSWLAAPPNG